MTGKLVPTRRDNHRIIYSVDEGGAFNFSIRNQWPELDDYLFRLRVCKLDDGTCWLATSSNPSLRVDYAHAKVRPYGSKVQVGLPSSSS